MNTSVSRERMIKICECLDVIKKDKMEGSVLEFGIFEGWSLSEMVLHCRKNQMYHRFYGFDGFQGMPEADHIWFKGDACSTYENTNFLLSQKLGRLDEVMLVPGFFKDSLIAELQHSISKAVLIHVDCDLYSSTVEVLSFCKPLIQKGTFVIFDEYIEGQEKRAWEDFVEREGLAGEFFVQVDDNSRAAREQGQQIFRIS